MQEHRLAARSDVPRPVESWLREYALRAGWPETVRNAFDLALEEWITNVISYGYEDDGEHWIGVRFSTLSDRALVEVEDDGKAFNPLTLPPVDTNRPLEERGVGGLGLHMIKQLMDFLDYQRRDGKNVLTLGKRLK